MSTPSGDPITKRISRDFACTARTTTACTTDTVHKDAARATGATSAANAARAAGATNAPCMTGATNTPRARVRDAWVRNAFVRNAFAPFPSPRLLPFLTSFFALLAGLMTAGNALAAGGDVGQTARQPTNWTAIVMFVVFVAGTLWITKRAAARTRSAADFYTAGGGITGFQNGLAIAGDFMSAATFLGISATFMTNGYDGLIYAASLIVSWPILTFLLAERLRNLGKFTFADVAGYRFAQKPFRAFAACSTLVVVAFYLITQMVGAGQLIKLLFGLDYWIAVVIVGLLMMIYVLFGGMTATTWVQIIKASLLLAGGTFMGVVVLIKYGFSVEALLADAVRVKTQIAASAGKAPDAAARAGQAIMGPGSLVKNPVAAITFSMSLMFGTLGLPHVLMRFFTVPNAKEARKSVLWATAWIGYFFLLVFIIGFGAITLVLTNPDVADVGKGVIKGGAGAANMAGVLVAKIVGGNVFYGFISAVAFATILAVVAGLTLSGASAVSHDLYSTVFKRGKADSAAELRVSRVTTVLLGSIAVLLGILFEKQNVAFLATLALAVAASANFPVLLLSVLWRGCTTRGAVIGGFLGLISSVALTVVSPAVWEAVLGNPKGSAWFPYPMPTLFSMSIAFVGVWLFSVLDRSARAAQERAAFAAQQVRSETGLGASGASGH